MPNCRLTFGIVCIVTLVCDGIVCRLSSNHALLEILPSLLIALRECAERVERTDGERVITVQRDPLFAQQQLLLVLDEKLLWYLFEHFTAVIPKVQPLAGSLKHGSACFILTDELCFALLVGDHLLLFDLDSVDKLCRELPLQITRRLHIEIKVMDLYKLESAARVLQEVADKQVHSALLLTVYVHLAKVLVELFDGFDGVGVRIGHTLDLHAVLLVIGIHCEQALQHAL